MTELNEITKDKSLPELLAEINYQLKNGECLGGTICSHIAFEIKKQVNNFKN